MALNSNQIMRYLALLADPEQTRITRQAWTVATTEDELVWAGWQAGSVVSVPNEPPSEWYERPSDPDAGSSRQPTLDPRGDMAFDMLKRFGLLPASAVTPAQTLGDQLFAAEPAPMVPVTPPPGVDGDGLRHLAARDELHSEESLGRAGWLFVAGSIEQGGERIPCCFPLFERRVKFRRVGTEFLPQWQGALRRNPLLRRRVGDNVEDPVDAFLRGQPGGLDPTSVGSHVAELLQHFDIELNGVTDPTVHPLSVRADQGTVLVPGAGFYMAHSSRQTGSSQNDLSRWTTRHLYDTALAELYQSTDSVLHRDAEREGEIRCALPLNGRQREAIDRLDVEPVVAVSGPPGTGKTHMIVAAASDAVARGLSVLIATKSDFAAESTCELLDYYPTPPHVRFGRAEHRRRVADLLSAGSSAGITDEQLERLQQTEAAAWREFDQVGDLVLEALERKQDFERAKVDPNRAAASGAPRLLDHEVAVADVERVLARAETVSGLRQRWAVSKLRKMLGSRDSAPIAEMKQAIAGARSELAVRKAIDQAQGQKLDELWSRLDRAETDAKASQAVLDIAKRSRPRQEAITSVAALATALRSTLGDAALALPIEANAAFLHAVPFWVGTLDEIETTLPANPGMFDLVIFDEASQIDQISAVPALCRAKRALVVGDPNQLRHTSSITAQQIAAARTHEALRPGDDAAILDVAANSLFDVAASATPVTWLNEHFRSIPHLIEFASSRWYNGELRLMTQHPRNEGFDVIHSHRVTTQRGDKTNHGEVEAIVAHIERLRAGGHRGSVGVVTPFVEQADALERAILEAFDYDTIRDLRLRVGTVRGVQGTERDTILLSLVIDDRDFEVALKMIEDPHVFNVMTTRARSELVVFHSFDPALLPPGVLNDWFRYEDAPPGLDTSVTSEPSEWTRELAEALALGGLRVVTDYPVAGWTVDLVVGEGHAAFGVETSVHPDGARAHSERHLTLRRAGWDLVSMFESSWLLQPEQAAVHLASIAARRSQG